jgi:hypothetical protein
VLILGLIVLLLLATAGLTLVKASRDLDAADDGDLGPVTGFVDERLQRTRVAVDTLIQPDAGPVDVRPSRHALRERATTYGIFGLGLVGIATFVAIGYVLLRG